MIAPVIYTDRFLAPGTAGRVLILFLFPVILIRPEYRDDKGLLAHERVHAEQCWLCILPFIHGLMYRFSEKYRLVCEVEAYREQLKHYPDDRSFAFAAAIADQYDINITVGDALALLKGHP